MNGAWMSKENNMDDYFENPELKKSTIFIIISAFIFMAAAVLIINENFNNIRKSYIKSNMALLGEVTRNHPEFKSEAAEVITKGSTNEDVEHGKKIFEEYGYSEDLNIGLIKELNSNYKDFLKILLLSGGLFFIIFFAFNFIQYKSIYKKLDNIILASKNMFDNNFDIDIYKNSEGTFAKLACAFDKMRIIVKNNLLEINKEKTFLVNILSDISHQIKTPIASLIIYNDILLNRKVDEEKRINFLTNSRDQLYRIDWLVRSLLKLAKIDAKAIKFEKNVHDLNETCMDAVESLKVKAESSGINLEFLPQREKIMMNHDKKWLEEAIINIIKNAIEHTNIGGYVKVYTEKTSVFIKIIIKDNGEGIKKDEISHVFERFYKGKGNKKSDSVGIGLSLSKSIVEAHNGIIEVKSVEKVGTEFSIVFLLSDYL